jgi:hypothetical protein
VAVVVAVAVAVEDPLAVLALIQRPIQRLPLDPVYPVDPVASVALVALVMMGLEEILS